MSNLITNYNVNVNGVKQDLGTIIENTSKQTINIPTSGFTNTTTSLSFDPDGQQVIYDNSIYPSMSGSSVNGNTSVSFGAKKRYGDNGMWVAVGSGTNTIAYSYDGINWTGLGNKIFSSQGNDVKWNGSIWVAVGSTPERIAYSSDGINWTGVTGSSDIFSSGSSVAWNGKIFVAVGSPKAVFGGGSSSVKVYTIAYSYDGINWTGVTGSKTILSPGQKVEWNGTIWVSVGSGTNYSIAYSYDGSNNWTGVVNSKDIFTDCRGITWNGSTWIAIGTGTYTIAQSSDGINWYGVTNSSTNIFGDYPNSYDVAWNGTRFVALGGEGPNSDSEGPNSIVYSSDGINWSAVTDSKSIFSRGGRSVTWNGKLFVAVGGGYGTNYSIAYSSDGITWIPVIGAAYMFDIGSGIAWGGYNLPNTITFPRNLTLAGGSGTNFSIASSPDGSNNWVGVVGSRDILSICNGIAWNGTMWVAVGTGQGVKGPIAYSYYGTNNWTDISTNVLSVGNAITWNGKMWVAVGKGITSSIAYSYDGITWISATGTNNINLKCIAWNGNIWLAGGDYVLTSSDGNNWSQFAYHSAVNSIVWSGRIWVIAGDNFGINFVTSDGFYIINSPTIIYSTCNSIAWNGKIFVAGCVKQNVNFYHAEGDGQIWYDHDSSALSDCKQVTWNGTRWIAVGTNFGANTIAYSNDGIIWSRISNTSSILTTGICVASNKNIPSVKIQHPTIAVGEGTNSIAYSSDGITWTGLGKTIFTSGRGVAWNGTRWVAVGLGTNSIAYSSDGINWTGLGTSIFSSRGNDVEWNGTRWVAVGQGTNSIAYSSDGINWVGVTGTSASIFSNGDGIAWNGTRFVAVGSGTGLGTNSIAYSSDGITWSEVTGSNSIFQVGYGVSWNGMRWFAVGVGVGAVQLEIAYSQDGSNNWTGVTGTSASIFSAGYGVAWNGTRFVAVGLGTGSGTNSIAYSSDGINWTGLGTSIFSTSGRGVAWNGIRWVAVGQGTNSIAYSSDGITWSGVTDSTNIFTRGNGVAGNPKVGAVIVPSAIHLNNNINSNTLTFSSESYYQSGVNNISINVNTM